MLVITAAAAAVLLAVIIFKKIKHGGSCCGEHESAAAKIRSSDTDISHYKYRYDVGIEGMVCANCVRNAENAFNSAEGIYAKADLAGRSAVIYSKRRLERRDAAAMLSGTSYTLTGFREEEK